ncbi:hypothetical protein Salat_2120400 [Sesamum alatum]|uniref:Uncharacterized protein n=1 Tax=Sesamum alatum TaxID=300844 RepID=A0AAE2CGV0_9LAMI|nr:hypothetical protein Salat_2120400 [Sesamum alatum]
MQPSLFGYGGSRVSTACFQSRVPMIYCGKSMHDGKHPRLRFFRPLVMIRGSCGIACGRSQFRLGCLFAWRTCVGALLTLDNFAWCFHDVDTHSAVCDAEVETDRHVFLDCRFA